LRERAELGPAFGEGVEALKDKQNGFIFRAIYFDSRPDLVFVLASSKGVARPDVLERSLVLIRAAMAHYDKSRAMLIVDRDGVGFEVSVIESDLPASDEEIRRGARFFGRLKITDRPYSFVPNAGAD